ncbi:hypothetical protein B296_00012893 [Ensete ventricosum]|uniref:Uncharacterized protein n=1 Tax=Ensete ventricosum TaxID=4639 RepID=A0A427AYW7_ENSVE|nr:hypothetical protein B296_00012893 [Ensete ventricosum]
MKACHDFDSIMAEGSLAAIWERYSISNEYALHAPFPRQHLIARVHGAMCLYQCFGSETLLSSLPHYRGVSRVVKNFLESGSSQLVMLSNSIPWRMPRSGDYLDSKLVHGVLSPLQKSRRLLSDPSCGLQEYTSHDMANEDLDRIPKIRSRGWPNWRRRSKAKRHEAFRQLEASNKELNDTQVSSEYGYRVALARFRALHLNSNVEEDSFTILPEDDPVSMETQQLFNDSNPLKP